MKAGRSVVVVIVVLVVMSLLASVALADNGAKATGQGKMNTGRTFSFQAQERSDGSVDGSGVLNIPGVLRFKYSIDCLEVDGNVATMTGTIDTVRNLIPDELPDDYVGGPFWFRVVDNGEGAGATDQITFFYFDPPEYADEFPDCTWDPTPEDGIDLVDIIAGNVQVQE